MEWALINREAYGAQFNNLYRLDGLIKKEAKNKYGRDKIKNEIAFLKYVSTNNIKFPIPEIIEYTEDSYTMKYYENHKPLITVWKTLGENDKKNILLKIKQYFFNLYKSSHKVITKEEYTSMLIEEVETKLEKRLKQIGEILEKYKHVKKVNLRPIPNVSEILSYFKSEAMKFIKSKRSYILYPIHGDSQFNNILIGEDKEIIFIDPRGSYGNSIIYGIPEYDDAKIMFALSGYDIFDSMKIDSLNIINDSIFVDDLRLNKDCLSLYNFSSVLVLSIWLGNAHCFLDNPCKAFYSYAYAIWLFTTYLENVSNPV